MPRSWSACTQAGATGRVSAGEEPAPRRARRASARDVTFAGDASAAAGASTSRRGEKKIQYRSAAAAAERAPSGAGCAAAAPSSAPPRHSTAAPRATRTQAQCRIAERMARGAICTSWRGRPSGIGGERSRERCRAPPSQVGHHESQVGHHEVRHVAEEPDQQESALQPRDLKLRPRDGEEDHAEAKHHRKVQAQRRRVDA